MDYQVEAIEKFLSEWRAATCDFIMNEAMQWKEIEETFNAEYKKLGRFAGTYQYVHENKEEFSEEFYNAYTAQRSFPISRKSRMDLIRCLARGSQHAERDLNSFLDNQVKVKRENFIKRVEAKVGKIVDADINLGADGNLNGVVKGTEGKAAVETIRAGGYNVQSFHFRVLVKLLKK